MVVYVAGFSTFVIIDYVSGESMCVCTYLGEYLCVYVSSAKAIEFLCKIKMIKRRKNGNYNHHELLILLLGNKHY